MPIKDSNKQKDKLNAFERDFMRTIRKDDFRESCISAYSEARLDIHATVSRTPFCLKFIEIMGQLKELAEFQMPKRLEHEKEMVRQVNTLLFAGSIPDGETLPIGLIAALGAITAQSANGSVFDRKKARIEQMTAFLKSCSNEDGSWNKESENYKKLVESKREEAKTRGYTPEMMAEFSLKNAKIQTQEELESLRTDLSLIRLAGVKDGKYWVPDRDNTNASARVSKMYDETLGAGGINLAEFNV